MMQGRGNIWQEKKMHWNIMWKIRRIVGLREEILKNRADSSDMCGDGSGKIIMENEKSSIYSNMKWKKKLRLKIKIKTCWSSRRSGMRKNIRCEAKMAQQREKKMVILMSHVSESHWKMDWAWVEWGRELDVQKIDYLEWSMLVGRSEASRTERLEKRL